jgi:hypothetical protein
MKKILIATIILCFSLSPIHAEDYETTHEFAPGDTISADMFNELFAEIENVTKVITAVDLVGQWDLVQTTCKNGGPGNCSSLTMSGMSNDANGLTRSRSDTITFANDGDGTFSWAQTAYSSFVRSGAGNSAGSGHYAIIDGMSIFEDTANNAGDLGKFAIRRVSSSRYILSWTAQANSSFNIIRLDKRLNPPTNPTAFAIATTGLSNVLTWTDNSSDETGFKVYKKTSATGSWVLIDAGAGLTVNANIVTYTDTVSAAGDNWYRVKANNVNNGDSVGSKVIKTTNTN